MLKDRRTNNIFAVTDQYTN